MLGGSGLAVGSADGDGDGLGVRGLLTAEESGLRARRRRRDADRAASDNQCDECEFVSRDLSFSSFNQFRQFGNDAEGIAHDQQVGELANRRGGVFVDRDDRSGRAHADFVLNRTGDADRDVELRRDRLSGLSDLKIVRHPAGVGRRARRADRSAKRSGQGLQQGVERFRSAEPTPARDDDRRFLERQLAGALFHVALDHGGVALAAGFGSCDDLRAGAPGRRRERIRPNGDDAVVGAVRNAQLVISAPPSFGETQTDGAVFDA